MVSCNLAIPQDAVAAFCRRWKITELAVFGSALRDDFRPDSDVDVLVTFSPEGRWTLFDMVHMKDELEAIFGRSVDLVTRRGVEQSRNPLRRQAILSCAESIYVQR
jgi:predicted nucleotidyltransferase